MDDAYIRKRITELRSAKGVSEYKMSLDLGHSKNYVRSISSGKILPSMSEFLYICDYLNIAPKDFFDDSASNPTLVQAIVKRAQRMDEADLNAIIGVMDRIKPLE